MATAARTTRRRILLLSLSVLVPLVLAHLGWVVYRSARAYSDHKRGRGFIGRVYETDPELGFRPAPGARGLEAFPVGPDVVVRIDADGFRIPADAPPVRSVERPRILALGCSFTFGMGCEAQETFPYLVARRLRGSCLNAGCPGYGSAQMLILARRLIPAYRPDYVLFQHSQWLADRSRRRTAPSLLSSLTTPCFELAPAGIELRPPAYRSMLLDLPLDRYLRSPRGPLDFLSFELRVGIPLIFHDDLERCLVRLRDGPLRPPEPEEITRRVHAEVEDLCRRHEARMVLVLVGKSRQSVPIEESALPAGCLLVDATAALRDKLPDAERSTYLAHYGRWGGDPPALVDSHPNPLAHSIIAETIADAIEREEDR